MRSTGHPMAIWHTLGLAPSVLHPGLWLPCLGRPTGKAWLFSRVSKAIRHNGRREASLCPSTREGPRRVTKDHRPQLLLSSPLKSPGHHPSGQSQCPLPTGQEDSEGTGRGENRKPAPVSTPRTLQMMSPNPHCWRWASLPPLTNKEGLASPQDVHGLPDSKPLFPLPLTRARMLPLYFCCLLQSQPPP